MSKSKLIIDIHKFLVKIDEDKELKIFPKLQLKAKVLRWDLEEIFHFPDSQQAVEADAESRCSKCGAIFDDGKCWECIGDGGSRTD